VQFNSLDFLFFFLLVYGLYRCLGHRGQNLMLLAASYVFYGWWDVRFLFLIVVSTAVDFCAGLMIDRGELSRSERFKASGAVLAAALLCVTVRWDAVQALFSSSSAAVSLAAAFPTELGGWVVVLTALAVVAIANLGYPLAAAMSPEARRRAFLVMSVCANLGILGFFKYWNFFAESLEQAVGSAGFDASRLRLDIVLPVGISFYTFQTMSYTIDVFRRKMSPTHRFLDFGLFVAFFPQLVAGPIERASRLLPQVLARRTITLNQTTRGLFLILFGLFKKVVIADGVALRVDAIYNSTGAVGFADVVAATVLFAVQIYCDFSGYSDIARGLAKTMGFDLMVNFNLPYFAKNPSDFWRRWHISLSTWLRDYLYIPLGGNRLGRVRTYVNLMITMLLGGLWHGAAWNFVLWGFYHGAILGAHRAVVGRRDEKAAPAAPLGGLAEALKIAGFFVITCYGWLLFRANSWQQIVAFTSTLVTDFGNLDLMMKMPPMPTMLGLVLLIPLELIQYGTGNLAVYRRWPQPVRAALYAQMFFVLLMGLSNETSRFIYFQF